MIEVVNKPLIKAIETRWKGRRFRSRVEARHAVLFDRLGWPWEYEKEGFALPSGTWYLPDFWLPELSAWVEIKGKPFDDEEENKCGELAWVTQSTVVMMWGDPGRSEYESYRWDQRAKDVFLHVWEPPVDPVDYVAAVEAALSERFERRK